MFGFASAFNELLLPKPTLLAYSPPLQLQPLFRVLVKAETGAYTRTRMEISHIAEIGRRFHEHRGRTQVC